jgi:hypothetical protein
MKERFEVKTQKSAARTRTRTAPADRTEEAPAAAGS